MNTGPNTLFYSFDTVTAQARKSRGELKRRGEMYRENMFSHAFDDSYYNHVVGLRYRLDIPNRQEVFASREVEAMARLAVGSAHVVLLHKDGSNGEISGGECCMLQI